MISTNDAQLNIVLNAVNNATKEIEAIRKSLENVKKESDNVNKSSEKSSLSFKKLFGAMALADIAVKGVMTLARSVKDLATEGVSMSGKLEQSQATIYKLGENVGWTRDKINGLIGAIREENKDILTATELTKTAILTNLTEAQSLEIVAKGRDVAASANRNSNDAIKAMMESVVRLQPDQLRTYGIIMNTNDAYSKHAAELGKVTSQLTTAEKQQAFYNAMMDEAIKTTDSYDAAMDSWLKKANSVKDMMGDVKIIIGKLLSGAIKPLIDITYEAIKSFTKWAMDAEGNLNPTLQEVANIIEVVVMTIYRLGETVWQIIKDAFEPFIGILGDTDNKMLVVRIALQIMGNFFVALIKTIGAVISTFTNFATVIFGLGKVMYAFVKDGIDNFKNFGKIIKQVFSAIGEALKGNFKEAGEILRDTLTGMLSNTLSEFENFSETSDAAAERVANSWSDVIESWKSATDVQVDMNGEAFDSLKLLGGLFAKEIPESVGKSSEAMNKQEEALDKLITKVVDYKKAILDIKKAQEDEAESFLINQRKKAQTFEQQLGEKLVSHRESWYEAVNKLNELQREGGSGWDYQERIRAAQAKVDEHFNVIQPYLNQQDLWDKAYAEANKSDVQKLVESYRAGQAEDTVASGVKQQELKEKATNLYLNFDLKDTTITDENFIDKVKKELSNSLELIINTK
ncbi:MAG: APC family permease [Novosphingobium sp.]|nr:APC family permease [Novosphingobium sp.]